MEVPHLEAVLFDMDGVVINSAAVADRILIESAAAHGAHLTDRELHRLNGASGVQFWSYVKDTYGLSQTVEELYESYDAGAEVAAYSPKLIASGLAALLVDLVGSGVRVGLVTSGRRWRALKVLDLLGDPDRWAVTVCGEDTAAHKPDPSPYRLAAESLAVHPSACLAIEDSRRGIQSARAAGMVALAYRGFGVRSEAEAEAHGVVEDFGIEELKSLRRRHSAGRLAP